MDSVLHVAARVLLRTCPPLTAHAVLTRIGRYLPQRHRREDIHRASLALGARGTCLTRALALAATAPNADVVIGVNVGREAGLSAHAWLEIDGRPLADEESLTRGIARLPGRKASLGRG